jgi:hypothetical protein
MNLLVRRWQEVRNNYRFHNEALLKDDYLRRIRSLVIGEGMLHDGNILQMNYAIQHMPKEGTVVEIGSYGGLSASVIVWLMHQHQCNTKFFTTDPWIYESYTAEGQKTNFIDGSKRVTKESYHHYMKSAFMNAMQFLQPQQLPHSFEMTSQDFFELWNTSALREDIFGNSVQTGGSICFAYIDGDHSLEAATHDFEQVDKHLAPGGFILLDDSADHLPFGSARLMNRIKQDPRYRVVSALPNYLIQKI